MTKAEAEEPACHPSCLSLSLSLSPLSHSLLRASTEGCPESVVGVAINHLRAKTEGSSLDFLNVTFCPSHLNQTTNHCHCSCSFHTRDNPLIATLPSSRSICYSAGHGHRSVTSIHPRAFWHNKTPLCYLSHLSLHRRYSCPTSIYILLPETFARWAIVSLLVRKRMAGASMGANWTPSFVGSRLALLTLPRPTALHQRLL